MLAGYGLSVFNQFRHVQGQILHGVSCINIHPIHELIEKRKLLLFGQLCNLDTKFKIKEIFIIRLSSFMSSPRKIQGFVPDIYRILGKYNLFNNLNDFFSNGQFLDNKVSNRENSWIRVEIPHSLIWLKYISPCSINVWIM